MTEIFEDAYPPQGEDEYVILKIASADPSQQGEYEFNTKTTEFIRVSKKNLEGKVKDVHKRDYSSIAASPQKLKAFKERLGAVVTDAIDSQGVQQPGRRIEKSMTGQDKTNLQTIEMHVKNGKLHSPTLPNGQRKHAVIQTGDLVSPESRPTILIHAHEGKYNNVLQPDGRTEFGETAILPDGQEAYRKSFVDHKLQDVVINGKVEPAIKSPNYIAHYQGGKRQGDEMIFDDNGNLEKLTRYEDDAPAPGSMAQPTSISFRHDGTPSYATYETASGTEALEVNAAGELTSAGIIGKKHYTTDERMTLLNEQSASFNAFRNNATQLRSAMKIAM